MLDSWEFGFELVVDHVGIEWPNKAVARGVEVDDKLDLALMLLHEVLVSSGLWLAERALASVELEARVVEVVRVNVLSPLPGVSEVSVEINSCFSFGALISSVWVQVLSLFQDDFVETCLHVVFLNSGQTIDVDDRDEVELVLSQEFLNLWILVDHTTLEKVKQLVHNHLDSDELSCMGGSGDENSRWVPFVLILIANLGMSTNGFVVLFLPLLVSLLGLLDFFVGFGLVVQQFGSIQLEDLDRSLLPGLSNYLGLHVQRELQLDLVDQFVDL